MTAKTPPLRRPEAAASLFLVCPRCGTETVNFFVVCAGHPFAVSRCPAHGDVVPQQRREVFP